MKKVTLTIANFLSLLYPLYLLSSPTKVLAAHNAPIVESLKTTINIESDASLLVTETISVNFPNSTDEFKRPIPKKYTWNGEEKKAVINVISVRNPAGVDLPYKEIQNLNSDTVIIGDKKTSFNKNYVFEISYRTSAVIEKDDLQNDFFFDALGTNWEIPIRSTEVVVNSPYANIVDYNCIAGTPNTAQKFCIGEFDQNVARFYSTNVLGQGKNLTIYLGIDKKGEVELPGKWERTKIWLKLNFGYLLLGLGVTLLTVTIVKRIMKGKKLVVSFRKRK